MNSQKTHSSQEIRRYTWPKIRDRECLSPKGVPQRDHTLCGIFSHVSPCGEKSPLFLHFARWSAKQNLVVFRVTHFLLRSSLLCIHLARHTRLAAPRDEEKKPQEVCSGTHFTCLPNSTHLPFCVRPNTSLHTHTPDNYKESKNFLMRPVGIIR